MTADDIMSALSPTGAVAYVSLAMAEPSFLQMLRTLFAGPDPAPPPVAEPVREPPASPPPAEPDLSRVPAAAKDRVATIRALVADLERRSGAQGLAGSDLDELRQIERVYLPRLLTSYAEIPPQHRAEIFRDTGRSASFLLTERLDKIVDRLNEMSRDFARGHLDAFSKNMRFIDMRYGPGNSPFD